MAIRVNCSWCHETVTLGAGATYCPACGHRAGVSRWECDCSACRRAEKEQEDLQAYRAFRDMLRGGSGE